MEEFLKNKHAEEYKGTDDDMSDHFDWWLGNLDIQEWFDYSDEYSETHDSIRSILNVPAHIRIAQHIYNSNRDVEVRRQGGIGAGVDIFNIEDEKFIRKCKSNFYGQINSTN